jgi:hypothetical protein
MTAGAFFRDLKAFTGDGGEGYDDEEPKPLTISGKHIYFTIFHPCSVYPSFAYILWTACKTDITYLISLNIQ